MPRRRLIDRREELGLTQQQVADRLHVDVRSVVRYESGDSTPRVGQRPHYAKVLRWEPAQLALALTDQLPPVNGHAVPGWLGHLASLEQAAAQLCAYEPVVVHGLLQTSAYACAIESVGPDPISDDEVVHKVENRLARQAVLDREPDPLNLSVVLDESVLLRVAGGADVMIGQLNHLALVAERPNVDLRVLPLDAGVFSAAFGSFALFTTTGATAPYMAVTEDRAGPHYLDRPNELAAHAALFAYLSDAALSAPDSIDVIRRAAKELYR